MLLYYVSRIIDVIKSDNAKEEGTKNNDHDDPVGVGKERLVGVHCVGSKCGGNHLWIN